MLGWFREIDVADKWWFGGWEDEGNSSNLARFGVLRNTQ
jgi:hypothetical protein